MSPTSFTLGDTVVSAGSRGTAQLHASRMPTGSELPIPVEILHGDQVGPTIWLSGALHGDEVVGTEIIRQVVDEVDERSLAGTIIAVPVVNVFGFVAESRYLPDRRDLNRSFPGSPNGSLAGQIAHQFLESVVDRCSFGLDFHAGSDDRTNLPQIRGNMDDEETLALGRAFGAPLTVHSSTVRGSLREAAVKRGRKILLYEGGEPRRFSRQAVDVGVTGTMRVLSFLGMVAPDQSTEPTGTRLSRATRWVRAPQGGIFRMEAELGDDVRKGQVLGWISGPIGRNRLAVKASATGVVLGHAVSPIVHKGDGLVHIAVEPEELASDGDVTR